MNKFQQIPCFLFFGALIVFTNIANAQLTDLLGNGDGNNQLGGLLKGKNNLLDNMLNGNNNPLSGTLEENTSAETPVGILRNLEWWLCGISTVLPKRTDSNKSQTNRQ